MHGKVITLFLEECPMWASMTSSADPVIAFLGMALIKIYRWDWHHKHFLSCSKKGITCVSRQALHPSSSLTLKPQDRLQYLLVCFTLSGFTRLIALSVIPSIVEITSHLPFPSPVLPVLHDHNWGHFLHP